MILAVAPLPLCSVYSSTSVPSGSLPNTFFSTFCAPWGEIVSPRSPSRAAISARNPNAANAQRNVVRRFMVSTSSANLERVLRFFPGHGKRTSMLVPRLLQRPAAVAWWPSETTRPGMRENARSNRLHRTHGTFAPPLRDVKNGHQLDQLVLETAAPLALFGFRVALRMGLAPGPGGTDDAF